jgi:pimeloyl-ACP methyl ester carboxylesterase
MVDRLILVAPDVSGYAFSAEANYEFVQIVMSIESDDGTPAGDRWLQSPLFVPAMANPRVAEKLLPIARENARFWLINPLLRRDLFAVPSAVQRLTEIQAPTLLVLGNRHSRDVQNMAQLVEDGIAGIRKAVIPEAGHLVNLEKPVEFNRIALAFLGSG